MKFTKSAVAALTMPAAKADHLVWDDTLPGFGIRLRDSGNRSWVVQYRVGGQQRRERLGDVRKLDLEEARKIARTRFAQVALGGDPAAERTRQRHAAASRLTLGAVADRYLEAKHASLRPSTFKAAEMYFKTHWAPLRKYALGDIGRADIAARLQELAKTNGRTAAARARGNLSALFGWAMREGLCEFNPVLATNDPSEGIKPRERILSDDELRAVWNACRDDDFGRIVRLLVLTGCRRQEIGSLEWREIDFDTGTLIIPGTRTKSSKSLELPLPPLALDILRLAPHREGRPFVFGTRGGPFTAWSFSLLALHERIAEAEGEPLAGWSLHDVRRTVRTGLSRLGIAPHVAELVIGHTKGGIAAVYDKHRYLPEIKAALARWAEHVLAVVEGRERTVVSLRA